MRNDNLELWWASLTIAQKERIARKGLAKASPKKEVDEELVRYPACSRWWNTLNETDKQKIPRSLRESSWISSPGLERGRSLRGLIQRFI
jgi:hypothetical protein